MLSFLKRYLSGYIWDDPTLVKSISVCLVLYEHSNINQRSPNWNKSKYYQIYTLALLVFFFHFTVMKVYFF